MNDLALKRLTAVGWTPDRKVDCSKIESEYAEHHLELPQVLREFFSSFAFLRIYYVNHYGFEKKHIISPRCIFESFECVKYELEEDGVEGSGFDAYKKYDLQPLFAKFGIVGEIYPIGSTCNGDMDIYYHENGKFYIYMSDGGPLGPLIEIGSNVDEMLNYLFGDDYSTRKKIIYKDYLLG